MELKGYKSRLEELQGLISKLEQGELSVSELITLENLTRDLHERSIILKYKAFESQVGIEQPKVEEKVVIEPEPEVVVEKEVEVVIEEETAPIDFSIFDDEEEMEELPMDEVEPEFTVEEEPEVEEHISISETTKEEEDVIEKTIEVKQTKETGSFIGSTSEVDNSLASRISSSKLDTLIGAFGLNERLRFINNLFDGSSELFSEAIKVLDSQNSMDEAANKVKGYAEAHDWDPEEDNVIEFMTYLRRRYA